MGPAFAQARGPVIVALGDSITAGYGLTEKDAWPIQVQKMLIAKGQSVTVVNAGVSGDTTAGGKARLAWSVDGADPKPTHAIIALGGNDALRALSQENAYQNLEAIILAFKKRNIAVLLAGMLAPPNLGAEYGHKFQAIYTRLAAKHKVLLYPFLLNGVAADANLNQADGIHPTEAGQKIIAARILPYIQALLSGKKAL